MALKLGSGPVSALRLGTATPSKVMLGTTQVWPAASGEPWTPADLTQVAFWYDCTDASKVTVGAGSRVQELRSIVGPTLTQGNTTQQPVYSANGIAAFNADSKLSSGTFAPLPIDGCFAGFRINTPAPASQFCGVTAIGPTGASSRDNWLTLNSAEPGGTSLYGAFSPEGVGLDNVRINGVVLTAGQLASFADYATGVATNVTGFNLLHAESNQPVVTPSNQKVQIACDAHAVAVPSARGWTPGPIADVLYFSSALSVQDRERLEGWSAHKNNSASVLPADHPYKNAPPTK